MHSLNPLANNTSRSFIFSGYVTSLTTNLLSSIIRPRPVCGQRQHHGRGRRAGVARGATLVNHNSVTTRSPSRSTFVSVCIQLLFAQLSSTACALLGLRKILQATRMKSPVSCCALDTTGRLNGVSYMQLYMLEISSVRLN